jgi:hypothetical protein
MNQSELHSLQDDASHAYGRVPQSEAAVWAQAMCLAEIALQLAKLNETLADMAKDMAAVNLDEPFVGSREQDEAGTHPPDCDCYYCSADEAFRGDRL